MKLIKLSVNQLQFQAIVLPWIKLAKKVYLLHEKKILTSCF